MKNTFILTFQGNDYTLANEPAGWSETKLKFMRHNTYNSVLRSVVSPIRFVKQDKAYLQNIYENEGFESDVTIRIYFPDAITQQPTLFFEGKLDLSTTAIDRDFLECEIIENNDIARFIANQDMEVDIESVKNLIGETVTDFPVLNYPLLINGAGLKNWLNAYFDDYQTASGSFIGDGIDGFYQSFRVKYTNKDVSSIEFNDDKLFDNQTGSSQSVTFDLSLDLNYNFIINSSNSWTLQVLLNSQISIYDSSDVYQSGVGLFSLINDFASNVNQNVNNQYSGSVTTLISDGYYAILEHGFFIKDIFASGYTFLPIVSIEVNSVFQNSLIYYSIHPFDNFEIQGFTAQDVIQRSLKRIVKDGISFNMPVLEPNVGDPLIGGKLYPIKLVSGNGIRKLPNKTNIKFSDYFKSLCSIEPLGLYFDSTNVFQIDSISSFYQNYQIFTLGSVTDFKRTLAVDKIYNQIEAGSKESIGSGELNSKVEVNGLSEWSVNLAKVKNTLNLSANYRVDSFGIIQKILEEINTDKTQKNEADEDKFLVSIVNQHGTSFCYPQKPINFVGAPFNDLFNYDFTPHRLVRNNGHNFPYLLKIDSQQLTFNSSKCAVDYEIQMIEDTALIVEKSNIPYSEIASKLLYECEYYEFSFPVTEIILSQLNTNPHGYITFDFQGTTYKGYIIDVEINMNDFNAKWKLIKYFNR